MTLADNILFLLDLSRDHLLGAFLVFLRVGAAMALLPGFGEQSVSLRVRLMLGLAFTAVVYPAVPGDFLPEDRNLPLMAFMLLSETVAGLALGIAFRLFVIVLQFAGSVAAHATSLSQVSGSGATPDPSPAFGNLLVIAGLALAMIAGLHVKVAVAFIQSYDVIALGSLPLGQDFTRWGIAGVSRAFALGFSLAAPFVIASVIYNVALGVINRAMPQLMVAFVGAPVITFGGLFLLFLTASPLLLLWLHQFNALLASPFSTPP